MGDDEIAEKYAAKADRMIRRWSGVPGRTREAMPDDRVVRSRESNAARRLQNIKKHVVTEPAREIEVLEECEVLVVGAGPAGLSAALGARRAGADVILLERFGCFGGVIVRAAATGYPTGYPTGPIALATA